MYNLYFAVAVVTWAYLEIETDAVARGDFFSWVVVAVVLAFVYAVVYNAFGIRKKDII